MDDYGWLYLALYPNRHANLDCRHMERMGQQEMKESLKQVREFSTSVSEEAEQIILTDDSIRLLQENPNTILETHFPPSPKSIIEIPRHTPITDKLIVVVSTLSELGHVIVLEGFSFSHDISKLLPFASVVKIDRSTLANDEDQDSLVDRLREYSVTILAKLDGMP